MTEFIDRIKKGKVLVADGATGTNLQRMGLKPGVPPENLVMENPKMLLELAGQFVDAGSDIILTCTFGGTALRMKESVYGNQVFEMNLKAVNIARQAALKGKGVLVGGSMGPTGQLMQPYGPLQPAQVTEAYRQQATALAEGGVDLLVIETMFSLEEADAAYAAARSATKLPVVVSFSYDRGTRTMMGLKAAEVIRHYADIGADMVGANCGTSLENMELVVREYREAQPDMPLWIKPNAGLPHLVDGSSIYDVTPEIMGAVAVRYKEMGAQVVGGCCGNTPEHVSAIARALKEAG
ncbi:MAG: homocysteine S-methyltransferase family protein [Anaerolineaceae bacterium]|nr:homocysteine S-methyltransferase family protein [Anaerolineaceae bacterium]